MDKPDARLDAQCFLVLLDNSLKAIPFNMLISGLLSLIMYHDHISSSLIGMWLLAVIGVSISRLLYSQVAIRRHWYKECNILPYRITFIGLTALMGITWGSAYFIFMPYIHQPLEFTIILIFGGLAAGSITALSAYMMAFYAYTLPMFLPVVIYNFMLGFPERMILSAMFLIFLAMVIMIGKSNYHLLVKTFKLSEEKDALIRDLKFTNDKLIDSIDHIRTLSITDALTNIFNRRFFDITLKKELERAHRNQYPLSLLIIDIDNFKSINDRYGHPIGDEFLIHFSKLLHQVARRANDTIFRIGGDEFAVILANISNEHALDFCNVLHAQFNLKNPYKYLTLSIGALSIPAEYTGDVEQIISEADKALYHAKRHGKNQIFSKSL